MKLKMAIDSGIVILASTYKDKVSFVSMVTKNIGVCW